MRRDPVLATRVLPVSPSKHRRVSMVFTVNSGLHYIKGNSAPYFSITVDTHRKGFPNQCQGGGAAHEDIERYFPGKFSDLIAMHLSDINGVPMHAEANGWYYLAGAMGGMGERFHGGNSKYNYPVTPPVDKPWQTTEYREPTESECLDIFARQSRLTRAEAEAVRAQVAASDTPRATWAALCEAMKPRWKAEAEACIANHGLALYGDVQAWNEREMATAG